MRWIAENPAHWDSHKADIIGGAPAGAFDSRLVRAAVGELLPGEWWRVEDVAGEILGYGWMDVSWGDAEILLATHPAHQGEGVGSYVLDHLEHEARKRGLRYLTNMVRPSHPNAVVVGGWLGRRGFRPSEDGRMMRAAAKE